MAEEREDKTYLCYVAFWIFCSVCIICLTAYWIYTAPTDPLAQQIRATCNATNELELIKLHLQKGDTK